jgi:VIT1/CCC1 family predicted Fe2+/Mn2+ transporter
MKDKEERSEETGWIEEHLPTEHVGDAILGAIDGIITTFAVVAGATGGRFSGAVIIVLGFANLFADGLSMGVSNYLGSKSERQRKESRREKEEARIRDHPEEEREKLREIYRSKGLTDETVAGVVHDMSSDQERWACEIVDHEDGPPEDNSVVWSGVATALAFIFAGAIPLLPFILGGIDTAGAETGFLNVSPSFYLSAGIAAVSFFVVGALKGRTVGQSWWRAGLETLATGGLAAVVAYLVGHLLRQVAGVQEGA